MVKINDHRPKLPDEIPTPSKKAKDSFSLQPCRISSVYLSEELLYEVFLRLPVKSLFRFRSVSKGMRGLIDSSMFIKNHNIRRRSLVSERARSLSVDSFSDEDEEYAILLHRGVGRFYSFNFDKDDNNNLNHGKASEFICNFSMEGMSQCCNGIFCFWNYTSLAPDAENYVLWNPSNGTFRKVDFPSCLPFKTRIGSMGYDIVNDDYKIISFIHGSNEPGIGLLIYSLRKDSWSKLLLARDFPSGWACHGPFGITRSVCVNGVMHWMWTNGGYGDTQSIFIVAFNLATETFTSLHLPSEARHLQPSNFTDFRGRLCITYVPPYYPIKTDGPHTVWVMEKYGLESSWSKLYSFHIDYAMSVPNFYFPNSRGRLLCFSTGLFVKGLFVKGLCWWDPQDDSYERIEITGQPDAYAHVYVRNLVRLDQSLA